MRMIETMKNEMNNKGCSMLSLQFCRRLKGATHLLTAMLLASMASLAGAQANDVRNGLKVTIPNGYANIAVDDMSVRSSAGAVRWRRQWDGSEWKFNPQWE